MKSEIEELEIAVAKNKATLSHVRELMAAVHRAEKEATRQAAKKGKTARRGRK